MKKLTFLAIFAIFASLLMQISAEDLYTRITEEPDTWDGEYIIACENYEPHKYVWLGGKDPRFLWNEDGCMDADGFYTDDGLQINWISTNTAFFKIKSLPDGGYSIRGNNNYFIGADETQTSIHKEMASMTTVYANDISISNGIVNISSRNTIEKYYLVCIKSGFFSFNSDKDIANSQVSGSASRVTKDLVLYKRNNPSNKVSTPYSNYLTRTYVLRGSTLTIDSDQGTHLKINVNGKPSQVYETNHVEITMPEDENENSFVVYITAIDPTGKKTDSDKVELILYLENANVENIKEVLNSLGTKNQKCFLNPLTVVYQNKYNYVYLKDETGSILVRNKGIITGLKNGDIINGGFLFFLSREGYDYYFMTNIQNFVKSETSGTPVSPTAINIKDVSNYKVYEYVTFKNVKYDNQYFYDRKDGSKIGLFTLSELTENEFENGKVYNITGFLERKSNLIVVNVISKEELQLVETPTITPAFGQINKGSEITISCTTEDAVLNGTINGETIENGVLPYSFKAEKNGEIIVNVWASKDEMENSEILSGTFTVETYAYKDVISYSDKEFINGVNAIFFDITRNGAVYSLWGNIVEDDQEVNHHLKFDRKAGNKIGIVMKSSPASVSSIAITWDESSTSGAGFIIYGKNCPYKGVYQLHDAGEEIGTLITTVKYSESTNNATTVELGDQFSFIGIRPVDSEISNIKSIEFSWNENTQGGQDVSYKKATSTYISDGRFAVLSTIYGDAVKREETLGGHLNSTEVEISSSTISLAKGQTDVDEFEILKNKDNTYYLRGGLESNDTRRYLAGVQYYGLKLLPEPDETAKVTLEKKSDGIVVKFKDGDYLMYGDNKFVKGGYVDNATPTDEDVVLMPVYVYVSSSNNSTGVEEITINEDDSDTMYFNLNGVRINAENITPGIYIVRQGNKVSKKVIR